MEKRVIFILIVILSVSDMLMGQASDSLLIELSKELNPAIITWVEKPKDCLRDTTKKLMPNPLPNHQKIIQILKDICSSKDTNYIAPLKAIYLNYIPRFSEIWGYRFQRCEIAWKEQYQILATFEGTLRSLIWLTDPDRNEKVLSDFNLDFLIFNTKNGDTLQLLYDQYPLISEEFRTLKRRNGWNLDFGYKDRYIPYQEIIHKEVMNDLYAFQPGNRDESNGLKWSIVTNNDEVVRNHKSDEKIKFFSENMKKWVDNGYSSFLIYFVGDQLNHPEILPKLWKCILFSDSLAKFSLRNNDDFRLFYLVDFKRLNADSKVLADILFEYVRPMETKEQIQAIGYFRKLESERVVDLVKQLVACPNVKKNLSAILELKQVASFFERQHKAERSWKKIRKQLARFEKKLQVK